MSLVGKWVETEDGMLLEVIKDTGDFITGVEVIYKKSAPVRYGEEISVKRSEILDDEEEYDNLDDIRNSISSWTPRMVEL